MRPKLDIDIESIDKDTTDIIREREERLARKAKRQKKVVDLVEDDENGQPEYPEGYGLKGEQVDLKGLVVVEMNSSVDIDESTEDIAEESIDEDDTGVVETVDDEPLEFEFEDSFGDKIARHKNKILCGVIAILLGGGIYSYIHKDYNRQVEQTPTQAVEQPKHDEPKPELSYNDKLKEELERKATTSGLPHKVTMTTIGGGYILGSTVYHPDEPTKLYTDFELFAPETKQDVANDATAKKIKVEFEKSLPKLGDTIEVKDKSKITLETYKMSDNTYQTIALNDGKPFAYIVTDKDGHHTNNVTSYYISDVAK